MSEFGSYVPPEVEKEAEPQRKNSWAFLEDARELKGQDIAGGEKLSDQLIEGKERSVPKEPDPLSLQGDDTSGQQSANDAVQQGDDSAASQQQEDRTNPFKPGDNSGPNGTTGDGSDTDELNRPRSHTSRRLFDGLR